jgi:hypothetical protein
MAEDELGFNFDDILQVTDINEQLRRKKEKALKNAEEK